MDSSDDDIQPDDPIVSFRTPQNRVGVRMRHMAFNAEAIRIVREMETMIGLESENIEEEKSLLILQMLQLEFDDERSLGLSSNSTSEEESMTISSHENSDGDTNANSSYSSLVSSTSSDTSDSDTLSLQEDDTDYEDRLIYISHMIHISVDILDTYCQQLFEFSVIRQSDMDLSRIVRLPRSKRQICDLTETESKDWTRFTKEQLYEIRNIFFETDHNEIRVLQGRRYYIEEILIISLTYQASLADPAEEVFIIFL